MLLTAGLQDVGSASSPLSTWVMNVNQWYYLEMQAAITTGLLTVSARVNGVEILAWTWAHGNWTGKKFAAISNIPPGGGSTAVFDDLYVTDDEYLGDVRIGVLYPNAPGDATAWTPSTPGGGSGTSYTNPGGSGNRTSIITVTASASTLDGSGSNFVNGAYESVTFITNGAAAGRWVKFDFGSAKVIDEIKLYREFAFEYGTWQWYGSNDDSAWTAVGPAQTAWTAAANAVNSLAGNTTGYRYYKFEGVSGTVTGTYNKEFEFKIGTPAPPAGDNWEQVDEHPTVDDDTTYVSAASTGLKDLYNLDDIDPAFVGTIKGVQALWAVKKSDEGEAAVKGNWKSSGTEIVQAAGHNFLPPNGFYPSATSYLYNIQTERKSLFTAADWTKTEINALQLGITRTV
jgi:hypothetical protein